MPLSIEDGRQLVGFVTKEAADVITIRDNKGKEIRIAVESIDERVKQSVSMMPKGLVDEVGIHDFVSLIDYLESLRDE